MTDNNATEATETVYASAPAETDAERVEIGTVVEGTEDGVSAEVAELRAALEASRAELSRFKRDVTEVTSVYAERHNLCEVVDTALGELGLRRPVNTTEVEVTLKLKYAVEKSAGRRSSEPSNTDVWTMVHNVAYGLRHTTAEELAEQYRNQTSSRGMVIEIAEVVTTPKVADDTAHILPTGAVKRCRACESPLRTRPSGALRCPNGCYQH